MNRTGKTYRVKYGAGFTAFLVVIDNGHCVEGYQAIESDGDEVMDFENTVLLPEDLMEEMTGVKWPAYALMALPSRISQDFDRAMNIIAGRH